MPQVSASVLTSPTAPLVVRSTSEQAEDRQQIVLMLDDFSFTAPDALLADLTGDAPAAIHVTVRRTEALPAPARNAPAPGMSMRGMPSGEMGMNHLPMSSMTPQSMAHGAGTAADLNDIDYDAFLAIDRTLAVPEIVRVERSGRVRLRIINGSSASEFWIDLGALRGRVVATDGHGVQPVSGRNFPLAIAQRLDILLDLPASGASPILAQIERQQRRAGIVLSGSMKPHSWSRNGEYRPRITLVMLERGQRVEIDLANHSMMAHPMHLHGHAFQVIAGNRRLIRGAVRDTVLIMPMKGSVRIAFDADNPGRWALHCHNLCHMTTGMMTEFRYRGMPT